MCPCPSPELGANLLGDQESEGEPDEGDSATGAGGTVHPPEPAAPDPPAAAAAAGGGGVGGGAVGGPAPVEEGSTSGVSTINSVRHDDYTHQTLADLHRLRSENKRLLSELLESQRDYKELLRWTLSDKTLQIQLLAGLSPGGHSQPHHRQRQDTE